MVAILLDHTNKNLDGRPESGAGERSRPSFHRCNVAQIVPLHNANYRAPRRPSCVHPNFPIRVIHYCTRTVTSRQSHFQLLLLKIRDLAMLWPQSILEPVLQF